MSNFIQIRFNGIEPEQQEQLIAFLAEAGYDGFEERDYELNAFIEEKKFDRRLLQELSYKYQLSVSEVFVPEQNWNQLWESNFQPVIINDFVAVRTNFHNAIPQVQYEIIITPKMSFGTGHHATTFMMIEHMRDINFKGKIVFDFGTGTGILSILAEKLGAAKVHAIDNDTWSIQNAQENIINNQCSRIVIEQASSIPDTKFDIILANINKNVIVDVVKSITTVLSVNGKILLSGLLEDDEREVRDSFAAELLFLQKKYSKNNWISLLFSR